MGIFVAFIYDGKIYPENDSQNLVNIARENDFSEDIQSRRFFMKYRIFKKKIEIKGIKPIELIIIKDMEEDREIITGIMTASAVFVVLTIISWGFIFQKNFITGLCQH